MTLRKVFMDISPFRRTLLGMLRPYDIAKLAASLACELTKAEKRAYMDVTDDIFPDRSELDKIQDKGCCIHIFGADLAKLRLRLQRPLYYERQVGHIRLHIYVLISSPEHSLGNTVHPRWVRINSTYTDVVVNAYDNTLMGHHTPWVPMRSDLMESTLGKRFLHTELLQPVQQQFVPCTRLHGRSQRFISLYGDCRPKQWMDQNILDRQARQKYPNISFIVAPCWQQSYFMLHIV
ncbi:hypothetical protein GRF29_8g2555733 [Pseudopithomyces chartarum]|uniref:Uncharacterized protein n=1 Tax=Pseudopithomyces chartarum TaxID=1892770 RepID=A0AAN6M6Q5_9PLEO|nr:hypothetical protein GRF29_8g2555733 [Pseudopithomyces chartarum]